MIKRGQGRRNFPTFVCCSLPNFVFYIARNLTRDRVEKKSKTKTKRRDWYSLHFALFLNLFPIKYKVSKFVSKF